MSKLLKVRKISPYEYGLPLGCRGDDRFIVLYNQQFSEKVKTTKFFFNSSRARDNLPKANKILSTSENIITKIP